MTTKLPEFKQRVLDAVPMDRKVSPEIVHETIGGAAPHRGPCFQMLYDLTNEGRLVGNNAEGYRRVR